jgi:dTDP-4-amino-4,6-dideoxygalactose transaminase
VIKAAHPLAQYQPHRDKIKAAIDNVLESGVYLLGPQLDLFESELGAYLGAKHVVGCGSGTDALVLAMLTAGIGRGDEVILPSHTASATVASVLLCGATPVYIDIEPNFYTIDPSLIGDACSSRTKAIIAVHLYGQAADLVSLREISDSRGLTLIEDCAQSLGGELHGRKLGTFGDFACFSFFPTKNLGCLGDGGAVVCKEAKYLDRLKSLRQYGWDQERVSQQAGLNSRMDEIQAAVLRVKLPFLSQSLEDRTNQADKYLNGLADSRLQLPSTRSGAVHSYSLFVARVNAQRRENLIKFLEENGVIAGVHYAVPAHKMPAYGANAYLPVTEKIAQEVVSLPLYPGLTDEEQDAVISTLLSFDNCEDV